MKKRKKPVALPSLEQIEEERNRIRRGKNYRKALTSTVSVLVVVAALAVLVATLLMPVLQIYGSSMTPTLVDGDIVLSIKTSKFEPGDVVAFYYNNKILVKRVIAVSGDWVDITEDGDVYVNSKKLEEPYLEEKALGSCNIELPYQVPESRIFVMGDHRSVSVDSRNTAVGPVAEEQIVGRLEFRVWPLKLFGAID
ncbi:MAG: signal peptidase I [Clostridia bacterium]|nr:signal peptidase I [Clostridia bacterium]MBQ4624776.1 signal peptidase I [Clostridia bacterium]